MAQSFSGKERDADDWAALVADVDHRLHIQEIKSPPHSLLSVIYIAMK